MSDPTRREPDTGTNSIKASEQDGVLTKSLCFAQKISFPRDMKENDAILIAEDDQNDAELVRLALQRAGFKNPCFIVSDGPEVLSYLGAKPPYEDRRKFPFPRMLLLDIKMPIMNGFEVLQFIRSHPDCSVIPTIMMSASHLPPDIKRAYQMGANAYITKPGAIDQLVLIFQTLQAFWSNCELPDMPSRCA